MVKRTEKGGQTVPKDAATAAKAVRVIEIAWKKIEWLAEKKLKMNEMVVKVAAKVMQNIKNTAGRGHGFAIGQGRDIG